MNALSADPDGSVHDYFGGVADARAGRVRFVGDPRRRLLEDRLRLLRFFRFHAHYGVGAPDPDGLAACVELAAGVPALSAERIRAELLKLLAAPAPSLVWAVMAAAAITPWILPEAVADLTRLRGLERLAEAGVAGAGDALLRLAALLPMGAGGETAAARLRLSKAEARRLAGLLDPAVPVRVADPGAVLRRGCYRQGVALTRDLLLLDAAAGPADPAPALAVVAAWPGPGFPLAGRDLVAAGLQPGPALGAVLRELEAWWEGEDFRPDRAACLVALRHRVGV
jgi:poly(A) polymerase